MHPLDGPLLKIQRAIREIKRLARAEESFRRDSDYRIVRAEFNRKTGKHVYRVSVGHSPDPNWGVYIGEIAHNLRSALNGMVHHLVVDNEKAPTRYTQFPIFLVGHTTRLRRGRKTLIPHFEGMELADGRCMIQLVSKPHQAMIERLQPYKRRNIKQAGLGRHNVLYLLHELNNADKHRLLQVVSVRAEVNKSGGFSSGFSKGFDIAKVYVLKDGAKLFEAAPGMKVDANIVPRIAFDEGCEAVRNRLVCPTLDRTATWVSEIVETFSTKFRG